MIVSKTTKLSRCDLHFLVTLAEKVNLSYRFYGSLNKSSLLEILGNKFDSEAVDLIVEMYLLCFDAKEVAEAIKPNGMDEIVKVIPEFFVSGEYLYEVSLGKRVCDVVLLKDEEVIAIEVKSASDDVSRAKSQVGYYRLWANRVYLAYDIKHSQKVQDIFHEEPIGLLEFANGNLTMRQESQTSLPESHILLRFTSHKYLRRLTKQLGINTKGTKEELAFRIRQKISQERIQQLFSDFLRMKPLSQDKATIQFAENEQTYPLEQFLKG